MGLESYIMIGFDTLGVLSHIKDILTNESNSNAYKARNGGEHLSIFYALHYINVRQVPGSGMREMFEIRDAYMINRNATPTRHCLNFAARFLQCKPFCRYVSSTPTEVPGPQEREKR